MEEDARSDEQLMLAYGAGNAAAFEVLYGRWRRQIFRFLVRQCASAGTALAAGSPNSLVVLPRIFNDDPFSVLTITNNYPTGRWLYVR